MPGHPSLPPRPAVLTAPDQGGARGGSCPGDIWVTAARTPRRDRHPGVSCAQRRNSTNPSAFPQASRAALPSNASGSGEEFRPSPKTRAAGDTPTLLPPPPPASPRLGGARNSGADWPGARRDSTFERANQRPVSPHQPIESRRGKLRGRESLFEPKRRSGRGAACRRSRVWVPWSHGGRAAGRGRAAVAAPGQPPPLPDAHAAADRKGAAPAPQQACWSRGGRARGRWGGENRAGVTKGAGGRARGQVGECGLGRGGETGVEKRKRDWGRWSREGRWLGGREGGRRVWGVLQTSSLGLALPQPLAARGAEGMPLSLPQYNQPFEDAPLVQMSTLTYETPQGTESSPPSEYLQLRV